MTNQLSHNQPTILKNGRCAYCNEVLTEENCDKEHVIGRRFVPKGAFNQQWNLHLNSCKKCNNIKSDLENDISAITLAYGPSSESLQRPDVQSEALRKIKTTSRKTGKPVASSNETMELKGCFGPMEITFNMVAPPQVDRERIFWMAWYQLAGFFFFLTYKEESNEGYHWPGAFIPLGAFMASDWGHPFVLGFAEITQSWQVRFVGSTAAGFYRVAIRRHPEKELWSWALEWNKGMRVIGFLGDIEAAEEVIATIPKAEMTELDKNHRYRLEQAIPEGVDDLLFAE